jgi:EmrB/QacA subfamily drug resistance transporter
MPPDTTIIEATAERPPASASEIRTVMTGLMLALTLASLDGNIVGPALPRIVSDLGGLSHLSWVVTGFSVASTAATPLYGKLSDQFGRKPAFFVSIGLFLAGSVLCGMAQSMMGLIAARALQGVGASGLITLSQTTIADLVSPRERGRYQGWVASVFAICSVAGPLLGGVITDRFSWPWIFYINVPVGLAAIGFIATAPARRRPTESRRVDVAGFALMIGGTCLAMLTLSWGGVAYPWTSPLIIALGTGSVLAFFCLVLVERRALEPALPPRLFADSVFVRGVSTVSLASMAMFGSLVFIPLFFQLVLGATATEAGLRMAPLMGGLIIASVIGGRLVTKTGRYKIFPVIGMALTTAAFILMSHAALAGAGANAFDALLVCLGAGMGLVMPNITTAIQNAVATRDLGVANATQAFFRSLGAALGVALAGMLLNGTLRARLPASLIGQGLTELQNLPPASRARLIDAYGHALSLTFAVAAGIAALAFAIVLFLPERPLSRTDRP